jgi:hypothetical protein
MANKILPKFETYGTFTLSLAPGGTGLASSTTGVGRQSTMVDNTTTRFKRVRIYGKVTLGTSPTKGAVYVYGLTGSVQGSAFRTDGAGASDASFTVLNADPVAVAGSKSSPSTGDVIYIAGVIEDPGPEFGIAVVHDTVAALNGTGGNHVFEYVGEEPELQ